MSLAKRRVQVLGCLAISGSVLGFVPAHAQQQVYVELDVPYVPTPPDVVAHMLTMGSVGPNDYVIDLGSGDGRIAIAAVRDFKARGAMGVDIDPERVNEANANAQAASVADKVTFQVQDLFDTDLDRADVITMYLLPDVNLKLRPRLLQLKPGTRLVSHQFTMGEWSPDEHKTMGSRDIYHWVVPARVAGQWRLDGPDGPVTLNLTQNFQRFEGTATHKDHDWLVSNGVIQGANIRFTLSRHGKATPYAARVQGDSMVPQGGADTAQNWSATRVQ